MTSSWRYRRATKCLHVKLVQYCNWHWIRESKDIDGPIDKREIELGERRDNYVLRFDGEQGIDSIRRADS